jgi:hypothetical protein
MVKGPGSVIFTCRSVLLRQKATSRTSTGRARRMRPTTRGTTVVLPVRPTTSPGRSGSMPSSDEAKWLE